MAGALIFLFGAAFGSFLNVLAVRYDPDRFLFADKVIGGRSHCPNCKKILAWYELVPVLSYVIQLGRCRNCDQKISPQYLFTEIASGLIFVLVPMLLPGPFLVYALWIAAGLTLLLMSLIDFRLFIIPDELVVFLGLLGLGLAFFAPPELGNRLATAALVAAFFAALVLLTRGRGMGIGDIKLAGAIGLLLGYPLAVLALVLSFVVGAVWGLVLIGLRQKELKSAIPFGPFLALGTFTALLVGERLMLWYLGFLV